MLLVFGGRQLLRVDVREGRLRSFSAMGKCRLLCSKYADTICVVCSFFFGVTAKLNPRLNANLSISFKALSDKFTTYFPFKNSVSDVFVIGMILPSFLVCLVRLRSVSQFVLLVTVITVLTSCDLSICD